MVQCVSVVFKTHTLGKRGVRMLDDRKCPVYLLYWVVRKVRADFEGKLKRRRFKF